METIVKYGNRKLYSKDLSRYVNLNYVIDLVKTNQNFKVVHHQTQVEITDSVLAECVVRIKPSSAKLQAFIRGL
jgi:polyhydroxyalkanoate synthesis regulator protein